MVGELAGKARYEEAEPVCLQGHADASALEDGDRDGYDILMDPVLLVSEEVMEIIRLYDRTVPFLSLVLSDNAREKSAAYYYPVLEEDGEILYRTERSADPRSESVRNWLLYSTEDVTCVAEEEVQV